MAKEERLAYFAGITDGEGCIYIRKTHHKDRKGFGLCYQIAVSIEMTSKKIVEMFFNEFGGSMLTRLKDVNYKRLYSWVVSSNKARDFLVMVLPYLVEKRKQAELALELHNTVISKVKKYKFNQEDISQRESYYQQIKSLNRRGR